jgi:hypothetical protein
MTTTIIIAIAICVYLLGIGFTLETSDNTIPRFTRVVLLVLSPIVMIVAILLSIGLLIGKWCNFVIED